MLSENQFWTLGTELRRKKREMRVWRRRLASPESALLRAVRRATAAHTHEMIYARRAVIFGSDAKTHN